MTSQSYKVQTYLGWIEHDGPNISMRLLLDFFYSFWSSHAGYYDETVLLQALNESEAVWRITAQYNCNATVI